MRVLSDMHVACQDRKGDTATFFSHENQPKPPSLVSPWEISSGKALLESLQSVGLVPVTVPQITAHVIDGPAMVHFLLLVAAKTFGDYFKVIVGNYVD